MTKDVRKREFNHVELEGKIRADARARMVTVVCLQKEENGNNLAGCQRALSINDILVS